MKNKRIISGFYRAFRAFPCSAATLGALFGGLFLSATASAQVNPESKWRTIRTERFYIHYTPELEDVARRTAVQAESAYVQLSKLLKPPRGKIDVIIGDNVDGPNGYATPYPTNRIGIYAASHVLENSLRFTDDHIQLVLTHELTHIFHLDRAEGWWGAAQKIFGRYPFFFPNVYQPTWMIEGLATYYESRVTGAGRVVGSDHRMVARSAAIAHRFPRIDQLSAAQTMFPYGYITYTYGSLFLDRLAKTHGDAAMEEFVAASSRRILPWTLNGPAKKAFGVSFTTAYRRWADSLTRSESASPWVDPIPGWRDLTVEGAYANMPRWQNDSTILYVGTPGREAYGLYRLSTSNVKPETLNVRRRAGAQRERLARRHSRSPNVVLSNGDILYSEVQFSGLYDVRSDLYVDRRRGGKKRLTHNARLLLPDARKGDDRIVAVQLVPAGSRLVLVSRDGKTITPLTSGSQDESWTEPRWSPDGKSIAAIHWTRGGTNAVVVLDTAGSARVLLAERALMTSPSWSPDGAYVYFDSDRDGVPNLYRAVSHPELGSQSAPIERVSSARTGLFEAQISPSGKELAAVVFKADGYHIGIAPIDSIHAVPAEPIPDVAPRQPVTSHQSPVTGSRYSAIRQLLPRYWFPYVTAALDSNSARYGLVTSGTDIAGRHSYDASVAIPTDGSGLTGAFFYQNATLGRPLLDFYYTQDWTTRADIIDRSNGDAVVGTLRRRIRDANVALYFPRPRVRTFSYFNIGLGYEARNYETAPAAAIDRIDSLYRKTYYYPRVSASFGWSNVQTPLISISQEDGISFASTVRYRWRSSPASTDTTPAGGRVSSLSTSGVTALSLYKSLDLGGYAHHVIAARGVFGAQDNRGADYFEIGGVSGDALDVVPGYYLGEGRRTFSVRGFPEATLNGIRAFEGSVEYRAPLRLAGRGLGTWPLFFDRMSLTAFGDVGSAWCPGTYAARSAPSTSLCTVNDVAFASVPLEPEIIASAGGEVNVTAAVLTWDFPIRWRAGFAVPLVAPTGITKPSPNGYLAVGVSF